MGGREGGRGKGGREGMDGEGREERGALMEFCNKPKMSAIRLPGSPSWGVCEEGVGDAGHLA